MNKFFFFIFKNEEYQDIVRNYKSAQTRYSKGFSLWKLKQSFGELDGSFSSKKYISDNINDIISIDKNIKKSESLKYTAPQGYERFIKTEFNLTQFPPILNEHHYEIIALSDKQILQYQEDYNEINKILSENLEGVKWVKHKSKNFDYSDYDDIISSKEYIIEVSNILHKVKKLKTQFTDIWELFSQGREIEQIDIRELEEFSYHKCVVKGKFKKLYDRNPSLVESILGKRDYKECGLEFFDDETIEIEECILSQFPENNYFSRTDPSFNVHLEDKTELKRVILDSLDYGNKCNFSDSFTIDDFYQYRAKFDNLNVKFDESIPVLNGGLTAIKSYNQKKYGKSVSFIEDYYRCMDDADELYGIVKQYRSLIPQRNTAWAIAQDYSKGFKSLWGDFDFINATLEDLVKIAQDEKNIKKRDKELREIEKLEQEKQIRKTLEEKASNLRQNISYGFRPTYFSLDCFALYYYYPTNCEWKASESEWKVRNLVWDFKANPHTEESLSDTIKYHQEAVSEIIPLMKKCLNKFYGQTLNELTLVCIPSSKKIITERRYKDFSNQLCSETGMINGYDYVKVEADGEAKHTGGTTSATFSVDSDFFNGKLVILFDDVITSGRSMEKFKRLLENQGALVIGGFSIGRTKHTREYPNPIDQL